MRGGPTDVVVEPNIVRAAGAREQAREPGRVSVATEPATRQTPNGDGFWPLQPMSEPTPIPAPRPSRSSATEEPWLPPEPGARARPTDSLTGQNLTGLAAELSTRLNPPEVAAPTTRSEPAPRPSVAPVLPPPPQPERRRRAITSRASNPNSNSIASPSSNPNSNPRLSKRPPTNSSPRRARRLSTILKRRWPACWAVRQERRDRHFRPPCPSCDGGDRSSRTDRSGDDACWRAGHQRQFRTRQRADRARDPDDRAAHGAVAGAVHPRHDDVVHPHRGGAVAAAHRARHRHRPAQCGDRLARALPHRFRDGPGAAKSLRHRRAAAGRQRDHRRAGLRAQRGAVARFHAEERQRKRSQAVR